MGGLDRLTDGLMYRDLAGRRRLRRYVLAAIAIFILIGGITFLGWRQRQTLLAMRAVTPMAATASGGQTQENPTPTPAAVALAGVQSTSSPAPASEPSATAPPTRSSTPDGCPTDPNAWELLEIAHGDNFKRIAPPCVYDGLGRTVAWDLLQVMGYSAAEAAELLGFADSPWHPVAEITGMTNTQGPMTIELVDPSPEEIKQTGHPNLHAWIVDREGRPEVTFTLRGCYRTETMKGDRVESWGVAYPLVCILAMDQGSRVVLELDAHRYSAESLSTRRFCMYGYAGDGRWVSIGCQKEPFVEIQSPGSSQPASLPLTMDLGEIVQDRIVTSGLHGLAPWDAAWLEATFGLSMRPLPENWQSASDPSEYQAIQAEKEKWAKGRSP
jgi:hypothetical protein